ncbi:hypothetical protein ACU6TU_15605 [Halomonas sp. LS-001]
MKTRRPFPCTFVPAIVFASLFFSGCASSVSPTGIPVPPEAHPSAKLLEGPLKNDKALFPKGNYQGPIQQVQYFRDCEDQCTNEHLIETFDFDPAGRLTRHEQPGLDRVEFFAYEENAHHPGRRLRESLSGDETLETFYRHDAHGNELASVSIDHNGEIHPSRLRFRDTQQGMRVSDDPTFSGNAADTRQTRTFYAKGRLSRFDEILPAEPVQQATAASEGSSETPTEPPVATHKTQLITYDFHPNGQLKEQVIFGYINKQITSTDIIRFDENGLKTMHYAQEAGLPAEDTVFTDYVLDQYDNWISRQRCHTNADGELFDCRQEARKTVYYAQSSVPPAPASPDE